MLKTLTVNYLYHFSGIIVILLVSLAVFRNFILSLDWPASGDIVGWISREYLYGRDNKWVFVWRPQSFGFVEGINIMDVFLMLLGFITASAPNTAKVFAFSSFSFAGFAMYAFGYHYTRRNLAALAGSLIFILNQWYLTQLTEMHLDLMFSYALAPLIFLFFDRVIETRKIRDVLVCSFLLSIMLTSFHPQAIFVYGVFLAFFFIVKLFRPRESVGFRSNIKSLLRPLTVLSVLVIMMSACMWIPLVFSVGASYTSIEHGYDLERTYVTGYTTFTEAFTLAGKEVWGYVATVDVTKEISIQILPVTQILFFVFAVAYVVTFIFKRDHYSLFFGLSGLISMLISMGPYSPMEQSFIWAWFNVPYLKAFRVITRWQMMTAFANSFFACAFVSIVTRYLARTSPFSSKISSDLKADTTNKVSEHRDASVSANVVVEVSRFLKKFLYYFSIFTLVTIFLSGPLSTWFLFSQGLKVYTPPSNYIAPYEYLAKLPGDFKITTVTRSPGDWYSVTGTGLDFADPGMLTPVGYTHDIGFDSSFIHNKPVLQDGGLATLSRNFINYLRFHLARENITTNMLKMLGAFNYRYTVIPSYAPESTRAFFMSQKGGNPIYEEDESMILENEFYTPEIYTPANFALVFGGPKFLTSLFDIDSFRLDKMALVQMVQPDSLSSLNNDLLSYCSMIMLPEIDDSDLVMMPSEGISFIHAADYGADSMNAWVRWVKNTWWTDDGALVLGGRVLTTQGQNKIDIPFTIKSEGTYEISIRMAFAPYRGKLIVSINNLPIGEVTPEASFGAGLKWVKIADLHLEAGSYTISLINDGKGINDVDTIAIAEHSQLGRRYEKLLDLFRGFNGTMLYLIEAEEAFSKSLLAKWFTQSLSGEGYVLNLKGGLSISSAATA